MWKKHIKMMWSFEAPTKLDKWYGRVQFEEENTGIEGFVAFQKEFNYWFERIKDDAAKKTVQKQFYNILNAAMNGNYSLAWDTWEIFVQTLSDCFPNNSELTEMLASFGSRLLNFKMDNQNMAIHSQYKSWQSLGGYNNVYDDVFRFFTNDNMDYLKLPFTVDIDFREFIKHPSLNQSIFENALDIGNTVWHEILSWVPGGTDTDLILWVWHGDYLNLGAGAELGIYFRPHKFPSDPNGVDHYNVSKLLVLPMQLYLYNYEGENDIENIFAWKPDEEQWWITGFNPDWVGRVDKKTQAVIGRVDFSKFTDQNGDNILYQALKDKTLDLKYESTFVNFDDDNKTVWLCWYWDKELQDERN